MDPQLQKLFDLLMEQAGAAISAEVLTWGAIGLGGAAVLLFGSLTILRFVLGPVRGGWSGAWTAVLFCSVCLILPAGLVVGVGEGVIQGTKRALQESDFGRETLPAVSNQIVGVYALLYYADPEKLERGELSDLTDLSRLQDLKGFVDGKESLDTAVMQDRVEQLQGDAIIKLARSAREDMKKYTAHIDEFKPASDALDVVFEYATEERLANAKDQLGPLSAAFDDIDKAAKLRGDPSTITRDELAEHVRDNVVTPMVMLPVMSFVRPWQYIAAILLGIVWLFAMLFRGTAWMQGQGGGKDEELAKAEGSE